MNDVRERTENYPGRILASQKLPLNLINIIGVGEIAQSSCFAHGKPELDPGTAYSDLSTGGNDP